MARPDPAHRGGGHRAPPEAGPRPHRLQALLATGLALALLACPGEERAQPPRGPAVTLERRPLAAGTIRTEARTLRLDVDLQRPGQPLRLERQEVETRRVAVLAVSGSAITGARVTYVAQTREERVNGQHRVKGDALTGKTFGLELRDGRPLVTDATGQPVADQTARRVLARERQLGQPVALIDALPTRPIRVGERVEGLSAALAVELGRDLGSRSHPVRGLTVKELVVTLAAVREAGPERHVVLALAARVGVDDGAGLALGLRLRGELILRQRDGWPVSLSLQGPLTGPDGRPAGSYHGQRTYRYEGKD